MSLIQKNEPELPTHSSGDHPNRVLIVPAAAECVDTVWIAGNGLRMKGCVFSIIFPVVAVRK